MASKNYLWFAEADVETSNEAMLLPVDSYLGLDPVSGGVNIYFQDLEGVTTARETVLLNCADGNQKAVIDAFTSIMRSDGPSNDGFQVVADIDVADADGSSPTRTATFHKEFKGLVTSVAIS